MIVKNMVRFLFLMSYWERIFVLGCLSNISKNINHAQHYYDTSVFQHNICVYYLLQRDGKIKSELKNKVKFIAGVLVFRLEKLFQWNAV
jgi:hypothetical protein